MLTIDPFVITRTLELAGLERYRSRDRAAFDPTRSKQGAEHMAKKGLVRGGQSLNAARLQQNVLPGSLPSY